MAQRADTPEWIKQPVEAIRHGLVKCGYSYDELGMMKMEDIYKLNFLAYMQNYSDWYRSEKLKEKRQ